MSAPSLQPIDSGLGASRIAKYSISENSLERLGVAEEKIQILMAEELFAHRQVVINTAKEALLHLATVPLTQPVPYEKMTRSCPFSDETLMSIHRRESLWDDRIPIIANKERSQLVEALVDPEISESLPARIGKSPSVAQEVKQYQKAEKYLYPRDIVRDPDQDNVLQKAHRGSNKDAYSYPLGYGRDSSRRRAYSFGKGLWRRFIWEGFGY